MSRLPPCWRGPLDLDELERLGLVRGAAGEQGGEAGHALQAVEVDAVRRVGRPVIVLVGAAEQVDGRNAGIVEAQGVGRQVRIGLHAEIEAHRDVGGFDQAGPVGARAHRLDGQAVVADPAHHVEVHVGRDLLGWNDGGFDEVRRAQKPEFLPGPEGERDVPVVAQLAQLASGGEYRGRARGVVVGTEVNGALLVRSRQRVAAAAPAQVVVVGADDDPRLVEALRLAAGQHGDHVPAPFRAPARSPSSG